jgi:outer membrane protein TolC
MTDALLAAWEPVGKYHRNEKTQSVGIKANLILGLVKDNKRLLTEQEAIEMALANNLDINLERHGFLLSQWELKAQKSFYDPLGTFAFNFDHKTTPASSILEGGLATRDIRNDYVFGYRQPFSTGTTLEVNFAGNRYDTTNFFAGVIPAIRTELSFLVRQDLLQGFGKTAAEYQIEIGRNNLDVTEQEFKRQAIEIVYQVQQSFWQLESSLKDVEVKEKSFELAQTVHDQNLARLEVGSAAQLEVVQTQAELELRREELIRAKGTYQRLRDLLVRLTTNLEDPHDFGHDLVPAVTGDIPGDPGGSFEKLMEIASEMRPEIQQAELAAENLEINLDLTKDQLRPRLEGVAGYLMTGLGGNYIIRDYEQGIINPPIIAVIPGGTADAFSQMFSNDFRGFVAGVNLRLPIKNTAARTSNAQAQIELRRAEMQKKRLRQAVALEIRDSLTQIEMNRARLEAAEAAVRSAVERLDGEEARFEVGMATTRQLIETQRDLLFAALTQVRARQDLIMSFAQLDKTTGQTLARHGIRVKEALGQNLVP